MRGLMKRVKKVKKGQKGFTLLEVIAVLSILAILVGLIVPNIAGTTKKGHAVMILGQHEKFKEAVYTYYEDTGQWPTEWSQYTAATDYDGTVDNTSENENDDTHQLWCSSNDDDTATVAQWNGPYIDRPILQNDFWNGDWGVIEDFDLCGFGNDKFTCLVYTNVPQDVCRRVDKLMDDGTGTNDNGQNSGIVQYDADMTINVNNLSGIDWDTAPGGAWDVDTDNVLVIALFKQ